MLYLVGFLVPPLAILLAGKPFQALFNLLFWGPIAFILAMTAGWTFYLIGAADSASVAASVASAMVLAVTGSVLLFPAAIHAWLVVYNHYADRRQQRIVLAMHHENQQLIQALAATNNSQG